MGGGVLHHNDINGQHKLLGSDRNYSGIQYQVVSAITSYYTYFRHCTLCCLHVLIDVDVIEALFENVL